MWKKIIKYLGVQLLRRLSFGKDLQIATAKTIECGANGGVLIPERIFLVVIDMPRPVLGESCTTRIKDFTMFPAHKKKISIITFDVSRLAEIVIIRSYLALETKGEAHNFELYYVLMLFVNSGH